MRRASWVVAVVAGLIGAAVGVPGVHAVPAGSITPVATGVPAGATAALANLTMVGGTGAGYVTADRCSALRAGDQQFSNGNFTGRSAVANLSVVPVDADGRFCVYDSAQVELVADVQGYLAPSTTAGLLYRPGGSRVLDTRAPGAARPSAGAITRVATAAPAGATAVLVNITMIAADGPGYVTADACSTLQPGEQTRSNGNYVRGTDVSNLSVVPVDADGSICIFTQRSLDLAVDVQGSFAAPSATTTTAELAFDAAPPARVLDTRVAPATTPTAGSVTVVHTGAPAGAAAVLANITMVDGDGAGYVTADLCSAVQPGVEQSRSNGNFTGAAAVANLSVVPIAADGTFCIFNQRSVNLAVDVQGVFSASGTQRFFPQASTRVLDTRPPTPAEPQTSCTQVVHIGDSTSVGMISPSVIKDPALRIDAQYRRVGVSDPNMQISGARSIVETLPGQVNAYDTAAAIKRAGYHGCWVFALGTTDTANIAAGSGPGRAVRIQKMMDLVAGDPVLWVNVRTFVADGPWSNANMQLWNNALEQLAPTYPNLVIYDWRAVANRAWFSGDMIHYTVDGYTIRGHMIADALAAAFPG